MTVAWGVTFDCGRPRELAAFWALALGYVEPPPPDGAASWEEWLVAQGVPEQEWDDAAYLRAPDGSGPSLSFLRVPESKLAKNRVHLDVKVNGGRDQPADLRRTRILATVDRLVAAGATVLHRDEPRRHPRPRHAGRPRRQRVLRRLNPQVSRTSRSLRAKASGWPA